MFTTKYKLGDIAEIQTGPFGSQLHNEDYVLKGTPIVTVEHLGNKYFTTQNLPMVSDADTLRLRKYILNENDIVFSRVGSVDRCSFVSKNEDGWLFSGRCLRVRPNNKLVNSECLYYYFTQSYFKEYVRSKAVGCTMPSLNTELLSELTVSLPDLITQQKIATILSHIDNKIFINREINRNLEELAKQIYDYWFVQFDFPNEDGKPYKSSGGKMVWNETLKRNIPEGWEVKKVDELAEIQKKQITPKENIEYKHYSLPNFDKYESYSIENGNTIFSDKFFVESGNLLISKLNPWTDRTVWVDDVNNAICSTEYVVLKQNDKCIQSYLNQIAHTQSFIDYCTSCSTGTSHSHRRVKPELMTGYKVPFQENIVKAFGKQIYPIIKKKLNIQNENRNLIIFRDELLPLLMNGQVTLNSCLSHD